MGWDGNFVIATKESLNKQLLNSHILEWFKSNFFNLKSISPKIALHFINRDNFGGRVINGVATRGYIGNNPKLEFLNYLDALEWGVSNEKDFKKYRSMREFQNLSFNNYLKYQKHCINWLKENRIGIFSTIRILVNHFYERYDKDWIINNEEELSKLVKKKDADVLEQYRGIIEKKILGKKFNHFYFGWFDPHSIIAIFEIAIEKNKLLLFSTKNMYIYNNP